MAAKSLVDANVLSELTRPQSDPRVVTWMTEHERELAIDPVILGELHRRRRRGPASALLLEAVRPECPGGVAAGSYLGTG